MSRVALVTGASRGIGRAIAEHLGAAGHRVAVNYHSSPGAAEEVVEVITSNGGGVGILVNNAGITRDGLVMRMGVEDWDDVLATNLRSAFLCTKAALRGMLRAKWGRIVNIASVSGIAGNPGQANYAAAKAGLIGFTKSVAKEVGSRGITVNAVAPGFIDTDMTADLGDAVREAAIPQITLGRFGTPQEIASAVGYLASDTASYITGQVIVVDGGMAI